MPLLSVQEVARRLRVSDSYVRRLCREGQKDREGRLKPHLKAQLIPPFNDRWAIPEDAVRDFEKRRRPRGRPKQLHHRS